MRLKTLTLQRLLLMIVLALPGALAGAARAATLMVTDPGDSGGANQLRQVLAGAATGDTVTFAPGVAGITLNGNELLVSRGLTVYGPGVTLNANQNSRVLEVSGGTSQQPVALVGLTVENGNSGGSGGGGVLVDGGATVMLTACVLTGNTTPGGAGGGIFNSGTLTLDACLLTGNSALSDVGGGLFNAGGMATVTGCTFTQNSADSGGALGNDFGGTATLTDDILYGDSARSGGEFYNYATLSATYSDIQGGYAGTGNLNADPLFNSESNGYTGSQPYAVQTGSPVVGAGSAAPGNAQDITGATRANPPTVGAYEGPKFQTRTTLTSSLNPSAVGQSVTFTATVADTAPGGPAPAGSVSFFVDGGSAPAATAAVSGTTASYATSGLAAGPHTVTATFTGSGFVASTSAALTQTVLVNTATTLTSSLNPSAYGQTVTLTATVADAPLGGAAPQGTVTFADGPKILAASVPLSTVGGQRQAAFPTAALGAGPHSLTATFVPASGTPFRGSASGTVVQTVTPAATRTALALTAGANPSAAGQALTFTATVSDVSPGSAATPQGAVTFTYTSAAGGRPVTRTVALSAGAASDSPALAAGLYAVRAAYAADATGDFAASASGPFGQLVAPAGARVLTVTDPGDTGGPGQLRQVLAGARPGDTVTFAPGVTAVALTRGEIPLAQGVTLYGPGVTLDAGGRSRLFFVSGGTASQPVSLIGLTLANGNAGNVNGGALQVNNGAVAALTACTLTGGRAFAGGGLYNDVNATVTLDACLLTSDTATAYGGGLYTIGTATVAGCTFSGDRAGGGTYSGAQGGALHVGGPTTVTDSILYGDTAPAGAEVYFATGSLSVSHSDVRGGYAGPGNLDVAPGFAGSGAAPFSLVAGSPVVGAGVAAVGNGLDITGAGRADPPTIGAYEGAPH